MSRRIDIELTSDRGDGTWTWRAAGARQPKGVVAGSLLTPGAAVGDQLRADVETTLDGTDVLSVAPPKTKNRAQVETIDLLPRGSDEPLVTQTLAPKRGGNRRDRGGRSERGGRGDRPDRSGPAERQGPRRKDRAGRDDGTRGDDGAKHEGRRSRRERDQDGGRRARPERRPAPTKPKRLRPGRTHRKAAAEAFGADEQILAEVLLRGGLPAVRQAVATQNDQVRQHGGRAVAAAPLLVIAERLYPSLRAAEWRDRAEAAAAELDQLDLRDLRSVVAAADSGAKDAESLALAGQLRDGLNRRQDEEQAAWLAELSETLREGRVVRALRLSSRPPKAGSPLPADLAASLTEAASGALSADTAVERWATVLDAVSFSPVRLNVKPASRPDDPSADLAATVTRMAERVPKVAAAFGIDPSAAPRRARGGRGGAKGGGRRSSNRPQSKPPPPPPVTGEGPDQTEAPPSPGPSPAALSAEPRPVDQPAT